MTPTTQDRHLPEPGKPAKYDWIDSPREIFGIDLRTLALFRILLGSFLILDLLLRSRDLAAHYTDFGIMPRAVALDYLSVSSFSLHLANGSAVFQALLFAVAVVFALMLIVGWHTRVVTVVCWALLLSLQNRNPWILSGEDNLVMVLTFWAMFLPLGARYSVDAALDPNTDRVPNAYFSAATVALLLQGMSMYFFSALLKSDSRWIPDGTAIYYALQLDYFVTPFAMWFRQFEPLLTGLTYYVYGLELIGPFLIFSPLFFRYLRPLVMLAFITMHIGFFLCLEIGAFPLLSIIMNLTFMPSGVWDRLGARAHTPERDRLTIWYDRDCSFCLKTCRLLRSFLFLGPVPIRPAQVEPGTHALLEAHNSWVISDGGATFLRWDAMRFLVRQSPVFGWLAASLTLAPLRRLGDRFYVWVAANRDQLSAVTGRLVPWRNRRLPLSRTASAFVAIMMVFVLVQNFSTVPGLTFDLPRPFQVVRQFFGLYQRWTLFAPYPELTSPWPVIEGQLRDGTVVDVYNGVEAPADFSKPAVVSAVYRNYRWRKFLSNMEDQSYEAVDQRLALNYGRYLCRRWNAGGAHEKRLGKFDIVFNVEQTPPPGGSKVVTRRTTWSHNCFR